MLHDKIGELTFDVGWKAQIDIVLFEKKYSIRLNLQAYFEEEGITEEQERAFVDFKNNEKDKLKAIENLLNNYSDTAKERFTPRTLLFERDGSYALLCDDSDEPDEGIAVKLAPENGIVSQDEFL